MYLLNWSANSPICRSWKVFSQKFSKLVKSRTPLFKKKPGADTKDPVNYRPIIPILILISNILERLANNLVEVFRMIRGLSSVPFTTFFELDTNSRTRGYSLKLIKHRFV